MEPADSVVPRNPNLLFILTDQQRIDTLACYGNDYIRAPNLNRLADTSFVFEGYCPQPVCTPSRGSIMSGLYPHAHGAQTNTLPLSTDVRTIAECLPAHYNRAHIGKWHLGDETIAQHGFDTWESILDKQGWYHSKPEYRNRRSTFHHFLIEHDVAPDSDDGTFSQWVNAELPEPLTRAQFVAGRTETFLRSLDERPFCLISSIVEPHNPFRGPLDDLYDPASIPVGPVFRVKPADVSRRHQSMLEPWTKPFHPGVGDLSTPERWREIRARYLGLVTSVDRAVGRILAALEASGRADETIVVFTSDHGEQMGDHHMFYKGVLFEESVRVPLLIKVPWISRSMRRLPGRVSQIDLLPTLLDLMDQSIPPKLHGRSLRQVLEGEESLADNAVVIVWDLPPEGPDDQGMHSRWRTLITPDGWKLNVSAGDLGELYDLADDPHEQRNRITDPAQDRRIRHMLERLRIWQHETGDTCSLPTEPAAMH